MKILLLTLMTFCSLSLAQEDDLQLLYQKGLGSYQSGNWEEAKQQWQEVLKNEPSNPIILFNLGLAHFRLENYSQSAGLWRRALFYDPSLKSAKRALALSLERLGLSNEKKTSWYQDIAYFMSLPTWLALCFICFVFACWFFINYLGKKRAALQNESPLPGFPYFTLCLSTLFLLFLSLSTVSVLTRSNKLATVVGKEVFAKSSPGAEATDLFKIPEGSEVTLKTVSEEWVQTYLPGGLSGWVKKEQLFQNAGEPLW